ncbi:uncharacterized protein [Dipodomys merriami]|uniref:uncharacterized protein isoform X2 n=1 Tax=Dipodomys merriami TaxID=94247 RepID=UPI00385583E4
MSHFFRLPEAPRTSPGDRGREYELVSSSTGPPDTDENGRTHQIRKRTEIGHTRLQTAYRQHTDNTQTIHRRWPAYLPKMGRWSLGGGLYPGRAPRMKDPRRGVSFDLKRPFPKEQRDHLYGCKQQEVYSGMPRLPGALNLEIHKGPHRRLQILLRPRGISPLQLALPFLLLPVAAVNWERLIRSRKVIQEEHRELLMEEFAILQREVLGKELLKGSLLFTAGQWTKSSLAFLHSVASLA